MKKIVILSLMIGLLTLPSLQVAEGCHKSPIWNPSGKRKKRR